MDRQPRKTDRLEPKRLACAIGLAIAALTLPSTAVMAQGGAAPDVQRAGVADTFAQQNSQYMAQISEARSGGSRHARQLAELKAETEVPVTVGGVELKIPVPPGHVRVSRDMPKMYASASGATDASTFRHVIAFMPVEQAAEALAGELPGLKSAFSIVVDRKLEHLMASSRDFLGLREAITSMRKQAVDAQLEEDRKRANQSIQKRAEHYGDNTTAAIESVQHKGVHLDTPRMIAFSMQARTRGLDESDPNRLVTQGTTLGFVHVNGKVLRMQNMAQGDTALAWSQSAWQQWGEQILALNPDGAQAIAANSAAAGAAKGAAKSRGMSSSLTGDSTAAQKEDAFWAASLKDAGRTLGILFLVLLAFRMFRRFRG